ncbi:hypothetical protein [Novosphingobium sp. KA1]|uniref:hypothetical protein n=1 Tax=Novosphingobium sp. (strain KA1) TaxID=164608 RepID=UPI001A90021B|nr:hypothetical protein [Novosphingobium sp. KA1]QSR16037.1 hypothetical protein CA833_02300 [Novosphingobium sp. KA1]
MTKGRAPLTIDAALARIAGEIPGGWSAMAALLCNPNGKPRSESMVRAWGDPLRREKIPLHDAIKLDLAYRSAGGDGAPLFETYGYLLDEAGMFRFSNEVALGRLAVDAIREGGEAHAALVLASQPGVDPRQKRAAIQEVEEAIQALHSALTLLEMMTQATGPPG